MRAALTDFRKAREQQASPTGTATGLGRQGTSVQVRGERATEAFDRILQRRRDLPGTSGTSDATAEKLAELEELSRRNRLAEPLAAAQGRAGVIEWFTASGSAPFTVALLVMLGLTAVELVSLLTGVSLNDAVDEFVVPHAELPTVADAPTGMEVTSSGGPERDGPIPGLALCRHGARADGLHRVPDGFRLDRADRAATRARCCWARRYRASWPCRLSASRVCPSCAPARAPSRG